MPGKEARDGFWYQDAKALCHLLDDAIARLRKRLVGEEPGPELRVGVECPVPLSVADENAEGIPDDAGGRATWDGVFARGDQVVVDECKLGGPSKPDRLTFYHRLRATIGQGIPVDRVTPRLTVGRGSVDPETWRAVAAHAPTIEPAAGRLARADTAEKLAAEALYYLATEEPEWISERDRTNGKQPLPVTRSLSLDDARALLSRLTFDATETIADVEARMKAHLGVLGANLAVDELVHALGGWINAAARQRPWRDDLTADSMAEKIELYGRYHNTRIEIEQLWHRLRGFVPALPPSKIRPQPWREVQPNVDLAEREVADPKRVVLTSEGGVGKSYLLASLHAEQPGPRIWIDSLAPLQDVERAVALGAWWTPPDQMLTVFIDAIDQFDDPAGLLAAVDRALATRTRSAIYVAARFATWARLSNDMHAWSAVRLERWPNGRIRALAHAGRTDQLSGDLIELLRTPLLLDLFLRTFPAGAAVPPGLATRHGVLREYFDRRVLHDEQSGDRREVLDAGVDVILANALMWRNSTTAARDLVSEGVLLRVSGDLRFRHALLRDYAAALRLVPRTADDIARALQGVTSPIVRNELLRGVIEAQLDPDRPVGGPSAADIIDACTRHDLAPAIALGTTDAPTAALMHAIAPLENGAVLRQAVEHAQLIDNRAWLRVPRLIGGARPQWFGAEHLLAMSSLAEFALAADDAASAQLAVTLRTWTTGHVVGDEGPWPIANIGRLLVHALADDDTVRWYGSLDVRASNVLANFLEPLRDLAANAHLDDEALLRTLTTVAFCLGDRTVRGHVIWEVTHLLLSNHRKKQGLLATRPYAALSLLFALSVLDEEVDARRPGNWRTDPAFAKLLASLAPAEIDAPAEQLRRTPPLAEDEAVGDLVDDVPASEFPHGDIGQLIGDAAHRAEQDPAFAECFSRAASTSRSVRARVLAIRLPIAGSDESVHLILGDARIYHVRAASPALRDAIATCWWALSAQLRERIQTNILETARSSTLSMSHVGELAAAVPRSDLTDALGPYVALFENDPSSTQRPSSASFVSGRPDDDDDDDGDAPPAGGSAVAQIEALAQAPESDEAAATQAVGVLRAMLTEGAGLDDATPDRVWYAVSRVVSRDEQRKTGRQLNADDATRLFEVALREARRRYDKHDTWGLLLDIADACPSYVSDDAASEARRLLMEEALAVAGTNAERQDLAELALRNLRPAVWLDVPNGTRTIFEDWFRNRLRGEALRMALRCLRFLDGKTQLALLRHVLETPGRLETDDAIGFIDDAGYTIAALCMWWRDDAARVCFAEWCRDLGRTGSLADRQVWQTLLSRFAWCLQNEVREATAATEQHDVMIARFVPLMTLAWSAWACQIDDAAERNLSVGWSVVAPLSREFEGVVVPVGGWSVNLQELIARVITEGARNDVLALEDVTWSRLDEHTLAIAARTVVARARVEITKRPSTDWMIGGLVNVLGLIGVVAALPVDSMRVVLDCLQHIGRSVKLANVLAATVARELHERESA